MTVTEPHDSELADDNEGEDAAAGTYSSNKRSGFDRRIDVPAEKPVSGRGPTSVDAVVEFMKRSDESAQVVGLGSSSMRVSLRLTDERRNELLDRLDAVFSAGAGTADEIRRAMDEAEQQS